MIRAPTAGEIPALRRIEIAAGAAFAAVGLPEVAADQPPPLVHLEAFRVAGRAWVACDRSGIAAEARGLPTGAPRMAMVRPVPAAAG